MVQSTPTIARLTNTPQSRSKSDAHNSAVIVKEEELDMTPGFAPPKVLFVLCVDDPRGAFKTIPLHKVRSWDDFTDTISALYSLTTQSIVASLDGDPIEPSLWPDFLVAGESYCLRFVPTITLRVLISESLKGPAGGKIRGWTVEGWAVERTVWEARYVLAKRLAEGGCRMGAESLSLVWWVEGSRPSSPRNGAEKIMDWKGKGKEMENDKEESMRIRELEGKTTMKEVLETFGVRGRSEKLLVKIEG